MAQHEIVKTVVIKAWGDIERKVYAFLIGGGVPTAVFAILAYVGVDTSSLPTWLPAAIAWGAATLAGYFTPNVVKVPVEATIGTDDTPSITSVDPEIDATV